MSLRHTLGREDNPGTHFQQAFPSCSLLVLHPVGNRVFPFCVFLPGSMSSFHSTTYHASMALWHLIPMYGHSIDQGSILGYDQKDQFPRASFISPIRKACTVYSQSHRWHSWHSYPSAAVAFQAHSILRGLRDTSMYPCIKGSIPASPHPHSMPHASARGSKQNPEPTKGTTK